MNNYIRIFLIALAAMMSVACEEATIIGAGTGTGTGTDPGTPSATPAAISLLANTLVLPSNANTVANGIQLTAILKDGNNVIVPGAIVDFSTADTGVNLLVTRSTTDASGQALATVTVGTNANAQANRTFTVTAKSRSNPTVTDTLTISITGTTLTATGATTSQIGSTEPYTVLLKDAAGNGLGNKTVTVVSSAPNTLSSGSLTTNAAGSATVNVTFNSGLPTDTLTFTGLGEVVPVNVVVTTDVFGFTATPAADAEINLNTNQAVTVCWTRSGAVVNGATLSFSTSRGTFVGGVSTGTTVAGCVSVDIRSVSAGFTTVEVTGVDTVPNPDVTLTASRRVEFIATTPATIDVQATPTLIGISEQSTINATVRDADANLVKNAIVKFEILADTTNGQLPDPVATTDSQGHAETIYQASNTTSSSNGIRIRGGIDLNGDGVLDLTDETSLTVGGQALRISLGTGNLISKPTNTVYEKEYTVTVTDSAGRPAPNAEVSLSIHAMSYRKGCSELFTPGGWLRTDCAGGSPISCTNEDLISSDDANDLNGILDAGEDIDGDNSLDPGNVAVVVDSDTNLTQTLLDADGRATFKVRYTQDQAFWADVRLRATARVGGSEGVMETYFRLTGLASDFSGSVASPPGFLSPHGIQQDCTREPLVEFTRSGQTVLEGDASSQTITIPVQMSLPLPTNSVTVPFTVTALNGATLGVDFSCSTASPLTIPASATPPTVNITCTVTGDTVPNEGLESFRITLGEPTQFALINSSNTHTVVIADNEKGVAVSESNDFTAVVEGGANDSYTIVLTAEPTATVTITMTPSAGGDLEVCSPSSSNCSTSAKTLTFTAVNWNTPQTVTVKAVDDATVELSEDHTISYTSASGDADYNGLVILSVTVSITDND